MAQHENSAFSGVESEIIKTFISDNLFYENIILPDTISRNARKHAFNWSFTVGLMHFHTFAGT